ncbi:hypothetical protein C8F04DRAFT_978182 [Mycena alexandri]|uniref:Reverse transcriptase zinc-binding domain-containing protein n=1 Tax=Mycena alexandri TaxID=1745969 RepID=A0AAD6WR86_9AGAR|nr:hypothetical protein C8F04DRAFT_978182 [Mycena alexandri]
MAYGTYNIHNLHEPNTVSSSHQVTPWPPRCDCVTRREVLTTAERTVQIPKSNVKDNTVKQITLQVLATFSFCPTPAEIWMSVRNKDFSRQTKNFLWKSIHAAHRIGKFWKHIPDCEDRAICRFCDEPEDLEHILIKCKRPGQAQIWSLAEELWLKKHHTWPTPTLGLVLGCGLAVFKDDRGKTLPGLQRFYRILISESIFMIWKIRNNCVISRDGEPLPENEIHNKWLYAMNMRLTFDRALTNHAKYGRQISIKSSLVLQTWSSTLLKEDALPKDWIKQPRVLVGIEPKSSHPPLPALGQKG